MVDNSFSCRKSSRHTAAGGSILGETEGARRQEIDTICAQDPLISLESGDWQHGPALTDHDWELLEKFHAWIDLEAMETFFWCDERWFNMKLHADNVCSYCIKVDRDIGPHKLQLFTASDCMDPRISLGEAILPKLSQVEELLIACVHCLVKVGQVRVQQYQIPQPHGQLLKQH